MLFAGGNPVQLHAKTFDLLDFMLQRHQEDVSIDEILAHVWPGVSVEPQNVRQQMSVLRRLLAKYAGETPIIVTLPGQRFRFVGLLDTADTVVEPVAEVPGVGGTDPPLPARNVRRRTLYLATLLLLLIVVAVAAFFRGGPAADPQLSIAVLPFRNLSAEKNQGYLADAVTDYLMGELMRIPGSVVIARQSAEAYQGRGASAEQIGRALRVRYLVGGTAQSEGGTVHIYADLADTATGATIWSKRFDVSRENVGQARDEIVPRLAEALGFELVEAASARSILDHPDDPTALDLVLRARSILDHAKTLDDFRAAQDLLQRANRKQNDFAEALAELGWTLVSKATETDDPDSEKDLRDAESVLKRTLQLSPRNERALAGMGRRLVIDGRYEDSISNARAALGQNPNSTDALLVTAYALFYLGRLDEAEVPLQAALRLDPASEMSKRYDVRLSITSVLRGRYKDAIDWAEAGAAGEVEPEPGKGEWGQLEKSWHVRIAAHMLLGDADTAKRLYARYATRWLHRTGWRLAALPPRYLRSVPGYPKFIQALEDAGMPAFAEETEDAGIAPSTKPIVGDDYAPTPVRVPGAVTLVTSDFARLMEAPSHILAIDVGTGTAVPEGASWNWIPGDGSNANKKLQGMVASFERAQPGRPVVILGDGAYGVTAYNEILNLTAAGFSNLFWYRGGEEAWAKAKLKSDCLRHD